MVVAMAADTSPVALDEPLAWRSFREYRRLARHIHPAYGNRGACSGRPINQGQEGQRKEALNLYSQLVHKHTNRGNPCSMRQDFAFTALTFFASSFFPLPATGSPRGSFSAFSG